MALPLSVTHAHCQRRYCSYTVTKVVSRLSNFSTSPELGLMSLLSQILIAAELHSEGYRFLYHSKKSNLRFPGSSAKIVSALVSGVDIFTISVHFDDDIHHQCSFSVTRMRQFDNFSPGSRGVPSMSNQFIGFALTRPLCNGFYPSTLSTQIICDLFTNKFILKLVE